MAIPQPRNCGHFQFEGVSERRSKHRHQQIYALEDWLKSVVALPCEQWMPLALC